MNRPVLVGALAGALALPSVGRADSGDTYYSLGLNLVAHFGKKAELGLGLEMRVTHVLNTLAFDDGCGQRDSFVGAGGFGRVTWTFPDIQIALGPHYAIESSADGFVTDFDLAWTYMVTWTRDYQGLQLGLSLSDFPIDVLGRAGIVFPATGTRMEGQVGLGVRFPGVFGDFGSTCMIGRPLRVDGQPQLAAYTAGRSLPAARNLAPETSRALGASWLEAARAESASVPAFLALARDLRGIEAPPALGRRAVLAARDEVRHAHLCEDLASRASAVSFATVRPPTPHARREEHTALLTRLALESWHDGCLGEGTAAARARFGFRRCKDPRARHALGHIARDEERHAELAWSVLEYAVSAGGRAVRDAVGEALVLPSLAPGEDAETRGADEVERVEWSALGRLDHAAVQQAHDEVSANARRRAERLLAHRA